jgi:tetratricopeptide (TPR) repeat protein
MATQSPHPGLSVLDRKYRLRHLWQVPVFVLGMSAILFACFGRPLWNDPQAREFKRTLSALRDAIDQKPADAEQARVLGEKVLPLLSRFPQRAGEVHYLLGSSYLELASKATNADKIEHFQQARYHLEQADQLGVPMTDVSNLRFRLGKTWFYTGGDTKRTIEYLAATIADVADDRIEGYGMLAQAYLHLPTPDLAAALQANQKQLCQPTEDGNILAPARLLRGELFLKLKQPTEAREALARIAPTAPAEIRAKAHFLYAMCCQLEGRWNEAAQLWERLLADNSQPADEANRIRYRLGVCYKELNKPQEAFRAWRPLLGQGDEESQAVAIALAGLSLADNDITGAMRLYERGLANVANPAGYHNNLVTLEELRETLERGCELFRQRGDFEHAQQLAKIYEKVAAPGVAQELRGLAAEAAALKQLESKNPRAAQELFREAAAAFVIVADLRTTAEDKSRWLRRSADRSIQAQDFPKALAALDRLREFEAVPEKIGESWFHSAQVYQMMRDEENALTAFRKCIEYPGTVGFRARLALAHADFAAGRFDEAEETLQQNLDLDLSFESDTRKQTVFALADLQHRRGKYRLASLRYQEALDHYPADPRAVESRFQLADCYRQLANLEIQRLGFNRQLTSEATTVIRERYRRWLMMAFANYQKLVDDLSARKESDTKLTAEEDKILIESEFALGECQIDLGNYQDAIERFQALTVRYRYKVEHLRALRQICQCYWIMRETDKARSTLRELRVILNEIDDKWAHETSDAARREWVEWIKWAEHQN